MENIVTELNLTENWDKILNLRNDGLMIVAPNGTIASSTVRWKTFLVTSGQKRPEN